MAHEACLFGDEAELVDRCVPFITEGLEAGQPTVLYSTEPVREPLLAALGPDAQRLALVAPAEDLWQGGHQTLLAWDALQHEMNRRGRPWRVVGEPYWVGSPEGTQWHRFEAICNDLWAALPCYVLCLHDRRALSEQVETDIRRTHPLLCTASGSVPSPDYLAPAEFISATEPPWTASPPSATSHIPESPRHARDFAADRIRRAGLDGRIDDVLLVVNELVTNSFEAGGRPVVTTWATGDRLVVEVADDGQGVVTSMAGYIPPGIVHDSGRGLWLAWALSDDATVRSTPHGTSIRVFFRLDGPR